MDIRSLEQHILKATDINMENLPLSTQSKSEIGHECIASTGGNHKKKISEDDIKKAVDKLNKLLEDNKTHVEYEIYGMSKTLTIKIVDDNENKVVKELPPKKLIDMVDKLCELAGLFVEKKV